MGGRKNGHPEPFPSKNPGDKAMSRAYEMSVTISGHELARIETIKAAAGEEWPFQDWCDNGEDLTASAEGQLCGGESEEEFTERLSLAIWKANGAYCAVTVDATYLESLPYETHCLDEADYARLIGQQQTEENQDAYGSGG
jgi:hypothetical protein